MWALTSLSCGASPVASSHGYGETWAIENVGAISRDYRRTATTRGLIRLRGCAFFRRFARARRFARRFARPGDARVLLDERLGVPPRLVVRALVVRRLHQVGGGAVELPADAVVERELAAADRVDHDAGRVRRVPHLELQLDVQRHV